MYSIRIPGWPLITLDTPEEIQKHKEAVVRAKAKLPLLFETEVDNKKYRVRGYTNDGEISGSVCEWLYNGIWKEVLNCEIADRIKSLFEPT
jgi:hypothetical protein